MPGSRLGAGLSVLLLLATAARAAPPADGRTAATDGKTVTTDGKTAAEPTPKRKLRFFALPNIAYDSDDGLGFGARGELAIDAGGVTPYKAAFVLHAFATLRGYHHHRFRLDFPGLGRSQRLRFTVHVAWRQWQNDGYWGIGNTTARDRAYVADFSDEDPARKRFRYSLYQPFIHATLRGKLRGPWSAFGALVTKWSEVRAYPGSLLEEQRPYGIDGGLGVLLSGGVLYDSRVPEVNPGQGILAELSGRVALPMPSGAGTFGGVFFSLRGFATVKPWLTLGARLMVEMLFGDIPFYEMVHWGGSTPVAGFGGFETLRGVSFGRWRGPGKAIVNLEARLRVVSHRFLGRPVDWQLGLFADCGAAFGAADSVPSGGSPLHPAAGAGVRVVFDRIFVGRFDVGVGIDPVREPDGRITSEASVGYYFVFDQAF